jgi:tripartite-type tricarboxylate transporter receptor subunit TctC
MRRFFKLCAFFALSLPALAQADGRVVKVVVPYAPGGNIDGIARLYSQYLGPILKETWIIENIGGASGTIGSNRVARATPDGTTLLFSADVHSMAPLVMKNVPYDPINDFVPVARLAKAPLIFIANPAQVKASNLSQLVQEIKADPQKYTFAIPGLGSSPHLGSEIFKSKTGLNILAVPYKGTGPAVVDVMAGNVNLMIVTPLSAMSLVRSGKLKALAVTSAQRFEGAPELPTNVEAGMPDLDLSNSYGFWGPKGMSKEAVARLSDAMRRASQHPELKKRLLDMGMSAMWESPEDFSRHIDVEFQRNRNIFQAAGIRPE